MTKTFLGGSLDALLEGDLFPAESTFVKTLALNFEMMLMFFVSGLKRHLAHGNFFLVPRIAEPWTFYCSLASLESVQCQNQAACYWLTWVLGQG